MAQPTSPPPLSSYQEVERALLGRWPETRLDPTRERIAAVCDLLGQPQQSFPSVHLTGTNGKTSTARMIETLLRSLGLRTGLYTSPHLASMTERICVDGQPVPEERFVEVYHEVLPYAEIVDRSGEHPLSFFEYVTAMAFATFADTPVDAGVVEVGMGGTWDATNVMDAAVAVVTPVGVDHERYLGSTPGEIAVEKSGIIKPGATAVLGQQPPDAAEVLMKRIAEVGATPARMGVEFGVEDRTPAVDGQLVSFRGLGSTYPDVFVPLHGPHQAHNAACALAAVEAFAGGLDSTANTGLGVEAVREGFAQVTSPGRLEILRQSPALLVDGAHNPHGAAALAEAVQEAFTFSPLIGVVGVMADKDVDGILDAFEPIFSRIVCTQNSTHRALPAGDLGDLAAGVFGTDRVEVVPRLDAAIERGVTLAEEGLGDGIGLGGGGVLVTGSVITAGEARTLLGKRH